MLKQDQRVAIVQDGVSVQRGFELQVHSLPSIMALVAQRGMLERSQAKMANTVH